MAVEDYLDVLEPPEPRRPRLKLYVWEGVLYDYTAGIAFALAYTKAQAKAKVIASGVDEEHFQDYKLDGVEPRVFTRPVGFHEWGGG